MTMYEYKNDDLKENASEISSRLKCILKKEFKLNRKDIAEIIEKSETSVSRKMSDKFDDYFTEDDINYLSKKLGVLEQYLIEDVPYKTEKERNNYLIGKDKLKKDYGHILDYLNSIGVSITPNYYWVGSLNSLLYAYDDLSKIVSNSSKKLMEHSYKRACSIKNIESDEYIKRFVLGEENSIALKLLSLPDFETDVIKLENISKRNNLCDSWDEFNNPNNSNNYSGAIQLFFEITNTVRKSNKKKSRIISTHDFNNFLKFLDNTNMDLIENFLQTTSQNHIQLTWDDV